MYKWCNSGFLCLYWLIQMPESQHGLVQVVCCSDLWALWVIVRHAGRGYGFIILWTTSLLITGMNLAFLSSHCSLYFCPELSVSNYSKSCSIDFKTVLKEASWKVLMQTHLKASFFVVVVCVEPAVTGLVATCWSQAARSLCWATPRAETSNLLLTEARCRLGRAKEDRQTSQLCMCWASVAQMFLWLVQKFQM